MVTVYLAIPVFLFLLNWVQPWLSVPLSLLLFGGLATPIFRKELYVDFSQLRKVDWGLLLTAVAIGASALFCTGITDNWRQTPDFEVRHDILYTLAYDTWPTVMKDGKYFVYYFQGFLPAAIFGKLVSWAALQWILYLWLCGGVFLLCLSLYQLFGRWTLLFFILLWGWVGFEVWANFIFEKLFQSGLLGNIDPQLGQSCNAYRIKAALNTLKSLPYSVIPVFMAFSLTLQPQTLRRFGAYAGAAVVVYSPLTALTFLPALLFIYVKSYLSVARTWSERAITFARDVCSPLTFASVVLVFAILAPFYTLTEMRAVCIPYHYIPLATLRFVAMWIFNVGAAVALCHWAGHRRAEIWGFAIIQLLCICLSLRCAYDCAFKGHLVWAFYSMYCLTLAITETQPTKKYGIIGASALVVLFNIVLAPSFAFSVLIAILGYGLIYASTRQKVCIMCMLLVGVPMVTMCCPKAKSVLMDNLSGGKLFYSEHIGIYQQDGGHGVWWWYSQFPRVEDVPHTIFK